MLAEVIGIVAALVLSANLAAWTLANPFDTFTPSSLLATAGTPTAVVCKDGHLISVSKEGAVTDLDLGKAYEKNKGIVEMETDTGAVLRGACNEERAKTIAEIASDSSPASSLPPEELEKDLARLQQALAEDPLPQTPVPISNELADAFKEPSQAAPPGTPPGTPPVLKVLIVS